MSEKELSTLDHFFYKYSTYELS